MPTVWSVVMPMMNDGDHERCRLIWEQLLNDPSVAKLEATEEMEKPFSRTITVHFKDGYARPDNLTLRALDKQFRDPSPRRTWHDRILDDD